MVQSNQRVENASVGLSPLLCSPAHEWVSSPIHRANGVASSGRTRHSGRRASGPKTVKIGITVFQCMTLPVHAERDHPHLTYPALHPELTRYLTLRNEKVDPHLSPHRRPQQHGARTKTNLAPPIRPYPPTRKPTNPTNPTTPPHCGQRRVAESSEGSI